MNGAVMVEELIKGKRILFISTKNCDYIRNVQEIQMIKTCARNFEIIAFPQKSYPKRIIKVWFSVFKRLFLLKKYDIIFIGFAPQLMALFFPFLRKKYLIIDFFISVYDTYVDDRRLFASKGIPARLCHKLDSYVLKKSDLVIVDTYADKNYFSKEFNTESSEFEVMYIKPDVTIYNPDLYPEEVKSDIFTVLYFGSILPLQGIEVILDTVELMRDYKDIRFIIIGPINKQIADLKKYTNAMFHEWMTQNELAAEISKADLCLAGHFNKNIGKADRTIAGKTYIYKAMNKPVILGNSQANHELFVEDSYSNFYVDRGDPIALKNKILEVKEILK